MKKFLRVTILNNTLIAIILLIAYKTDWSLISIIQSDHSYISHFMILLMSYCLFSTTRALWLHQNIPPYVLAHINRFNAYGFLGTALGIVLVLRDISAGLESISTNPQILSTLLAGMGTSLVPTFLGVLFSLWLSTIKDITNG